MIEEAIDRFNVAATGLQNTEFRSPRTPDEWQRMHKDPPPRGYEKLFNAVAPLIEAFGEANSEERGSIGAKLSPDALGILRTFASSMPVLAVRREAPELITQGLKVLAILGNVDDARDLCFYLATLHHSAMRLGIDATALFYDVASLISSPHLQQEMRYFPLRPPKDRDLGAFHFREVCTEQGYDLVQDPWRDGV
jgi:hypothetical protein